MSYGSGNPSGDGGNVWSAGSRGGECPVAGEDQPDG